MRQHQRWVVYSERDGFSSGIDENPGSLMVHMHYVLENTTPKPVDPGTWFKWRNEVADKLGVRQVAFTRIDCTTTISTVFTGLNSNVTEGEPLVFETLILGGDFDGMCWYWSTWLEAEVGHKRITEDYLALDRHKINFSSY